MYVLKNDSGKFITNRFGDFTDNLNEAKTYKRVGDASNAKRRHMENSICGSDWQMRSLRPVQVAIMEILEIPA